MILFKSRQLIIVWHYNTLNFLRYYEDDGYDCIGYRCKNLGMSQNSKMFSQEYTYNECIRWLKNEVLNG